MLFQSHPSSKKESTARKTGPVTLNTYRGLPSIVFMRVVWLSAVEKMQYIRIYKLLNDLLC